ncbi:MAG: putative glycoside hydrolase [Chloroflexota bacterium]
MDNRKIIKTLLWIIVAAIPTAAIIFALYTLYSAITSKGEQASPVSLPPFSLAGEPVRMAWFYKPPENGDLNTLVTHFDTFILTKADEGWRDDLRAMGVQAPFLQYLRFDAIQDPGSCQEQPWRNQVADNPGDFCAISQQHPDWFLLDVNGNRIMSSGGFVLMDPGNPEWRAFWLGRAQQSQETLGWDGVFLDNVEASMSKHSRREVTLANYPDDASFQAAVEGFLSYIYTSYFRPRGRPLLANIISLREPSVWFRYLQYLDGAMVEAWAVDWSDGYLTPEEWEEQLRLAEETQALGKEIVLVSQGDPNDIQRQQFAFACYLLVTAGRASFRYSLADHHREIWLYPVYDIDFGEPLGWRYPSGDVWKRDFTNGSVTVDPVSHLVSFDFP